MNKQQNLIEPFILIACFVTGVELILFKLFDVIDWAWIWVLLPIWFPALFYIAFMVIAFVFICLLYLVCALWKIFR